MITIFTDTDICAAIITEWRAAHELNKSTHWDGVESRLSGMWSLILFSTSPTDFEGMEDVALLRDIAHEHSLNTLMVEVAA